VDETTLLDASIIPPLDAQFGPEPMTADLLPPPSEVDTPPPRVFFVPEEDTQEHARPAEFESWTERVEEPVSALDFEIGGDTGPTTEIAPLPVTLPRFRADSSSTRQMLVGYELLAEIERRDHRRSYAGRDPDDDNDVLVHAVSIRDLPSTGLARERALLLFDREAHIAARISHPALPRLLHCNADTDPRVLVYERPTGTKLRFRLMAGQRFEPRQLRRIIRGVAEALHHLHERGIVFGALGPETVLSTEDGEVCLGDLSWAKPMDEPPHPRLFEQAYLLSPEFRSGGSFGPRSDQYALGGLLYELLSRKYPRAAIESDSSRLPPPDQLEPDADPFLSAVAMRLLDPLPGARFENCEALALHLTRAVPFATGEGSY
jgi:serine/threonine-protein kinase